MKLTKKTVIAGGAAAVLLLGSSVTFARWYDEASIGGSDAKIESGTLALDVDNLDCDWTDDNDQVVPGDGHAAVPGDTMSCTGTSPVTTTLVGDNLEATLSVITTGAAGDLVDNEFIDFKATVGGETSIALTEADNGKTYDVAYTVYFKEFKDSTDNTTHDWDTPDSSGSDKAQWWKDAHQGESFDFSTGDIKLQLVQNNR